MSDSVDLLMVNLENRMLESLCNSCSVSSGGLEGTVRVPFSDMLDKAMGVKGSSAVPAGAAEAAGGMSVSDSMVKFIEEHEGFASTPYRGIDSWNATTGYGHVVTAGENIGPLSQSGAESLLRSDLKSSEASVNKEFKGVKLTQGQFDALTSFAYNLGDNIWSSTPKLVSDIKSGAPADVMKADFENCAHCGGSIVKGLVNRRDDEWKVYEYGEYGDYAAS